MTYNMRGVQSNKKHVIHKHVQQHQHWNFDRVHGKHGDKFNKKP